jgi:hypothetical protein
MGEDRSAQTSRRIRWRLARCIVDRWAAVTDAVADGRSSRAASTAGRSAAWAGPGAVPVDLLEEYRAELNGYC